MLPSRLRRGWDEIAVGHPERMLLALTLALLAGKFGQRLLPPLLPAVIADLAITPFAAGVALSVLSAALALFQYPSGRFADRLTRKSVLLGSGFLMVVGLVVLVETRTYPMLLAGSVVFGAGLGLYGPADRALLSDLFVEARGTAFGIHIASSDLGGILAAGAAVVVVSVATWRVAFVPALVATVLAIALLARWGREPIVLSSVDLGIRETSARLLGTPGLRRLLVAYALFSFAGRGALGFLPTFLHAERGLPLAVAGATYAAFYAVGIVAKPVAGHLSDRVPRGHVSGGGLLVGGVGLGILLLAPSVVAAVAGVVVFAVGHRSFPSPMQAHLMDVFPERSKGGDLGATRAFYIGVGSLGPTYVGFVAGRASYALAYAGIVGCLLLGAAIVLSETRR